MTELEKELLEALKEALMPVEMYRAYGWADRGRVIPKIKTAIARAEAKAKKPQFRNQHPVHTPGVGVVWHEGLKHECFICHLGSQG